MKRIILLFIVIFAFSMLFSCQCPIPIGDSGICVQGKVYEWIDAPQDATGKIYILSVEKYDDLTTELEKIIDNINNEIMVIPIKDASIKIGEEKDFKYSDCERCEINTKSDENGDFEGWHDLPAFTFTFQVRVTRPDYIDAVGELENGEKTNHAIAAVLVKQRE